MDQDASGEIGRIRKIVGNPQELALVLPIVGYLLSYCFELGVGKFYSLPMSLVEVSLITALRALVVWLAAFFACLVLLDALSETLFSLISGRLVKWLLDRAVMAFHFVLWFLVLLVQKTDWSSYIFLAGLVFIFFGIDLLYAALGTLVKRDFVDSLEEIGEKRQNPSHVLSHTKITLGERALYFVMYVGIAGFFSYELGYLYSARLTMRLACEIDGSEYLVAKVSTDKCILVQMRGRDAICANYRIVESKDISLYSISGDRLSTIRNVPCAPSRKKDK